MKIIALLLAGLSTLAFTRAETFPLSEKFTQTHAVASQAVFSLNNINGSVEIVAWDNDMIVVEAEKRASNPEDLARLAIRIDASSKRVSVQTEHQRAGWFGRSVRGAVNYVVHVPTTLALCTINAVNSRIELRSVGGKIEASSVNGEILGAALAGPVQLKTINGNIDVSFAAVTGNPAITLKTVNGSCKIVLPDASSASVEATTLNGRINCDVPLSALKANRTMIKGHIGSEGGPVVEAHSINGNISINRY